MKSKSLIPFLVILVIVVLSLLGGYLVSYGTHWGPWADDDSAEYFEAARNLAAGQGVVLIRATGSVSPLSGRTPLYPIFLAVGVLSGVDILVFARWFDIVLYVLFILILGLGTYSLIRKPFFSIAVSLLIMVSPAFLLTYTAALTEPIFYTFGVASLLLLIPYFEKGNVRILTIASILAGLAFLSRFSGVIFVFTGVAGLLLFRRLSYKRRIMESAYFVLWSVILYVPYLYGVYSGGDTPGIYNFSLDNLWERLAPVRVGLVEGVWNWVPFQFLIPVLRYRIKLYILSAACLVVLGLLLVSVRRQKRFTRNFFRTPILRLTILFSIFIILYIVMMSFSHVFMVYPQAMFNVERHLAPLQFAALIVFFSIIYIIIDANRGNKVLALLPIAVTLVVFTSNIPLSRDLLIDLHENGMGLTSTYWRNSDVFDIVRALPEERVLISNESEAIIFWAQRPAYRVPEIWERQRLETFQRFGEDKNDPVQTLFREEGAVLVLFDNAFWQFYEIYGGEAEERYEAFTEGLYLYSGVWNGRIFLYDEKFHP